MGVAIVALSQPPCRIPRRERHPLTLSCKLNTSSLSWQIWIQGSSQFLLVLHILTDLCWNSNGQDGCLQNHQPPLGIELTGYRILYVAVILGFGSWKAVASYHGQSVMPTTLDWVAGTFLAVV